MDVKKTQTRAWSDLATNKDGARAKNQAAVEEELRIDSQRRAERIEARNREIAMIEKTTL